MIILGIDPGLRNTGFGIIKSEKNLIAYVSSGIVSTKNNHTQKKSKQTEDFAAHCFKHDKIRKFL